MATSRVHVTRTYGPIHFEDLDPHRFEDLVRELIYDYKDWMSIEATGRSGSDDGFDIRAYERAVADRSNADDESNEEAPTGHPMEGNRWMIQGKREHTIGPQMIRDILADVDAGDPPYGYILAASANFSKKSYDLFRTELQQKGVMEFYLWGKAELEDMLHLPKNDRILFTFFGISLVSKRRSAVAEVRSIVATKNKLMRVLGDDQTLHQSVLVRDLKDPHYPFEDECPDFLASPRWKEYIVVGHHPLGLRVRIGEYFASFDRDKQTWDSTRAVDLLNRQVVDDESRKAASDTRSLVEETWKFYPRANQAILQVDCLLRYSDIALVDEKGDVAFEFPHLYAAFSRKQGPFDGGWNTLKSGGIEFPVTEDWKRVAIFPKTFKRFPHGRFHRGQPLTLDSESIKALKKYEPLDALYAADDRYSHLRPRDVVSVTDYPDADLQVTHVYKESIGAYLGASSNEYRVRNDIRRQLGRAIEDSEVISIYEVLKFYAWQHEDSGYSSGNVTV